MKNIIESSKKLMEAIKELHPQLNMGEEKQEKLYMAYHQLGFDIAEYEEKLIKESANVPSETQELLCGSLLETFGNVIKDNNERFKNGTSDLTNINTK